MYRFIGTFTCTDCMNGEAFDVAGLADEEIVVLSFTLLHSYPKKKFARR